MDALIKTLGHFITLQDKAMLKSALKPEAGDGNAPQIALIGSMAIIVAVMAMMIVSTGFFGEHFNMEDKAVTFATSLVISWTAFTPTFGNFAHALRPSMNFEDERVVKMLRQMQMANVALFGAVALGRAFISDTTTGAAVLTIYAAVMVFCALRFSIFDRRTAAVSLVLVPLAMVF